MTSTTTIPQQTTAVPAQPSRQAVEAVNRSGKHRVSGRLKVAMDAMLYEGLTRKAAADKAGMAEHSLYVAFTKPHVKAYYSAGLEVLRTSARARNIHALEEVRDQPENKMARVAAVKALEQIDDVAAAAGGPNLSPGLVIVIQNGPQQIANQQPNGDNALIVQGSVSNGE